MAGYNGGFLGGSILPNASQKQPGIWSLEEVYRARVGGQWPSLSVVAAATGGDDIYNIVVGSTTYAVHQFTTASTGNFVLSLNKTIEYLIIGGGGAGGDATGKGGGGGGAGGFLEGSATYAAGTYTVTVGDGATTASATVGQNGGNSVFDTLTALGGGGGGSSSSSSTPSGGSGGGSVGSEIAAGTGTAGQGNDGGLGGLPLSLSSYYGRSSGGGGGANSVGANGTRFGTAPAVNSQVFGGAAGGSGKTSEISGTLRYYAGGGGGGYRLGSGTESSSADKSRFNPNGGLGGLGGGGNARLDPYSRLATDGAINTGSGGGAGGGGGGSGIVIVRYAVS